MRWAATGSWSHEGQGSAREGSVPGQSKAARPVPAARPPRRRPHGPRPARPPRRAHPHPAGPRHPRAPRGGADQGLGHRQPDPGTGPAARAAQGAGLRGRMRGGCSSRPTAADAGSGARGEGGAGGRVAHFHDFIKQAESPRVNKTPEFRGPAPPRSGPVPGRTLRSCASAASRSA